MQKTKLPSLVTILILTMITTVMWVGFSIYRAFTQTPPASVPEEISAPLTPSLDGDTINKIESAVFFDQSQIPAIATGTPVATTTPIPTRFPTPSATPLETPTSTPEATPTATP